jgi:3D (Asp-Asp-Asp) domain-containing protein
MKFRRDPPKGLCTNPRCGTVPAAVQAPSRSVSAAAFGRPRRRRPRVGLAAASAAAALTAGIAGLTSARGAESPSAADLRRDSHALEHRSRSALLELYSVEARLARARAQLSAIRSHAGLLAREQASARRRLTIARETVARAEAALAHRLRLLYELGEAHPLEIVLGAASLDEALTELDSLHFAAEQEKAIILRTRRERRALARLAERLARQRGELRRLEHAARVETASLESARAERAAYVATLASERRLKARQIAALGRQARAAGARAAEAAPAARPTAHGRQTLTVWVTGYALRGRTASGVRASWGVVAVDPSIIPLGTRLTIPGYGAGIAADVGGSVRGARIDVWFPSRAEALAWGGRAVTVTLH